MTAPTFRTDAEHITYEGGRRRFIAEISQLTMGGRRPLAGQIYNDALDEGFLLASHRTGKTARFVFAREAYTQDGELIAMIFKIDPSDARRIGLSDETTLWAFND